MPAYVHQKTYSRTFLISLFLIALNWKSFKCLSKVPGEGHGYPLQYSGLENSKDCIVLGVLKSQTQLSDFYFIINSK